MSQSVSLKRPFNVLDETRAFYEPQTHCSPFKIRFLDTDTATPLKRPRHENTGAGADDFKLEVENSRECKSAEPPVHRTRGKRVFGSIIDANDDDEPHKKLRFEALEDREEPEGALERVAHGSDGGGSSSDDEDLLDLHPLVANAVKSSGILRRKKRKLDFEQLKSLLADVATAFDTHYNKLLSEQYEDFCRYNEDFISRDDNRSHMSYFS